MTRDEAISLVLCTASAHSTMEAGRLVDCFVALGMLKLDAPIDAATQFFEIATDWRGCQRLAADLSILELSNRLQRAGLKIVEDK